jgi:hypothetical protein
VVIGTANRGASSLFPRPGANQEQSAEAPSRKNIPAPSTGMMVSGEGLGKGRHSGAFDFRAGGMMVSGEVVGHLGHSGSAISQPAAQAARNFNTLQTSHSSRSSDRPLT